MPIRIDVVIPSLGTPSAGMTTLWDSTDRSPVLEELDGLIRRLEPGERIVIEVEPDEPKDDLGPPDPQDMEYYEGN